MLVASANALNRKQAKIRIMKRYNNLYEQICTRENLFQAYWKARSGKTKTFGVQLFEKDLEGNLEALYQELLSGTYKTPDYSVFTIYEPKERLIYRLPFKDRVLHHAIMNVMEGIWVPLFITHTYSCVKGRGIHGALKAIHRDLGDKQGTVYCLKMDVKKFYPNIDHAILKTIIRKKIKDKKLLNLLDEIIDSAPGVPIGNYLSQFFANLYLSYFDHWLKEDRKVKYYYRYADDMVLLAPTKEELHGLRKDIGKYLNVNLRLDLKSNYQVFPVESRGIDFVGYVFRHNYILMRKSIKKSFCRKVARLNKRQIDIVEYKRQISPWVGWSKHCNSRNLIKKIIYDKVL